MHVAPPMRHSAGSKAPYPHVRRRDFGGRQSPSQTTEHALRSCATCGLRMHFRCSAVPLMLRRTLSRPVDGTALPWHEQTVALRLHLLPMAVLDGP